MDKEQWNTKKASKQLTHTSCEGGGVYWV